MSDVNDESETSPSSELIGWFLDPMEVRAETRRPGIVTGLSVLVPSPDSRTVPLVADLADQLGQMFRLEAVVAADDAVSLWRDSVGEGLAAASVGFRMATPAVPHRSAALDAVSGLASGEFVLLVRGELPDLDDPLWLARRSVGPATADVGSRAAAVGTQQPGIAKTVYRD